MFSTSHMLAYIDPGTGSLVLQMIVAGIIGTLAFFRNAVFRFLGVFKGRKNQPPGETGGQDR